jgi:GAF domain-containing protein
VKDGPKARFYAGVPITTPRGINIGVLCVLDDDPRDGLEQSQVVFLQSMASTVMSHLELVLRIAY